jgi:hypothetical protein
VEYHGVLSFTVTRALDRAGAAAIHVSATTSAMLIPTSMAVTKATTGVVPVVSDTMAGPGQ